MFRQSTSLDERRVKLEEFIKKEEAKCLRSDSIIKTLQKSQDWTLLDSESVVERIPAQFQVGTITKLKLAIAYKLLAVVNYNIVYGGVTR